MVLGALAGLGLVIATFGALGRPSAVFAQGGAPSHPSGVGSELIVIPATVNEKMQLLTVIDPKLRVMSVYHVELETGKIALRGVRNINWDLQMIYLNNDPPLPQEIRALLEQR
jgi:hypothetical protein